MNIRLVWLRSVARVFLNALLVAIVAMAADGAPCSADEPTADPTETIRLRIDYGDGVEKRFTQLSWKVEMTVGSLMELAKQHPRGIEFTTRGKGQTTFLTSLDDLANEGGSGRNWMFQVNGQMAQESFATRKIEAGDEVLWRFQSFP